MRHLFRWHLRLALLLGLLAQNRAAQAQRDYFNWYFGNRAGITFHATPAQGLADGQRSFAYGAACISDSAGQFVLASDGYTIWNRQWQPLASKLTRYQPVGFTNRQVLLVRQPGPGRRYYVLRSTGEQPPGQPANTNYYGTHPFLPYAVVDLNAAGGLGAVVARDSVAIPQTFAGQWPYWFLNGNWVPIRHANGRDLWLVGQDINGRYVSYLLTAAGLGPAVTSQPTARRFLFTAQNSVLRAAPDGRTLVAVVYTFDPPQRPVSDLEISRFDPATGEVTSAYVLPQPLRGRYSSSSYGNYQVFINTVGGVALSPDGSRLYADTVGARVVFQYDLLAGSPAAVAASRTAIPSASGGPVGDLQLGPDGHVYVMETPTQLGRIEQANALAPFCRLVPGPRQPAPGSFGGTFPGTLPDLGLPPIQISGAGTLQNLTACAGETVPFASSLSPFVTAAAYAWSFGDPASGAANQAGGQAPAHRYAQPGTYPVSLRVTAADGRQFTAQLSVRVHPLPTLIPTAATALCAGGLLTLGPGPQPAGTTYRWHDGSAAPTFTATQAGSYAVTVTSPQGCTAQATWQLKATECAFELPNVITPDGDGANDAFKLPGLHLPDWRLVVYNRWGREVYRREPYDNSWAAEGQPAGLYYYLLTHRQTGQRLKGWVEVVK